MSRKLDKAERERLDQPAKPKRRTVRLVVVEAVTIFVAIAGFLAALSMAAELLGAFR